MRGPLNPPQTLFGMEVRIDAMCEGKPRMSLAPQGIGPGKVYVSDKLRGEINAWMLARFGKEDDKVFYMRKPYGGNELIITSAAVVAKLRKAKEFRP